MAAAVFKRPVVPIANPAKEGTFSPQAPANGIACLTGPFLSRTPAAAKEAGRVKELLQGQLTQTALVERRDRVKKG